LSVTLAPSARLGAYEIVSLLGVGGMGEVYRAVDTRLHRTVAIKIVPPERVADPEQTRRFLQEARAASALNHPNIVAVYDLAQDNGLDFLVMEYVSGKTLTQLITPTGMQLELVVHYATQMAAALATAHAAGIVHRDIKPANVMVTADSQVKILDFGVAKLMEPLPAWEGVTDSLQPITARGVVVGTVGYMSPEQVRGESLDQRSDLFSLGCVVYEMATGTAPFARATAMDSMAALLTEDPPSPTQHGKQIPRPLEQAILRCLEKEPDRRFQSARDLADALSTVGGALTATWPAMRLSRRQFVVGASATALAVTGTIAYLRLSGLGPIHSLAVLPLINATGNPENDYLAEGISQNVVNRLSQTELKVTAFSTALRIHERNLDPALAGRQLKVAAVMTGRVIRQGGSLIVQAELVNSSDGTQMWGEGFVRPLEDIQNFEEEIAKRIAETLRLRLTAGENARMARHDTRDAEAHRQYLKGQYYWNRYTDDGFVRAIESYNAALERDPGYALAYAGLAHAFSVQGADMLRPPRDVMPKAKSAALKALELDEEVAEAHNALGIYALFYDWDWPMAQREFQRALALGPDNPNTLHFYGHYLEAIDRVRAAIDTTRRAVDLDPLSLIVNAEYGFALYCGRKYTEALQVLQKTLEMDRTFIFASWMMAQVLERLGRYHEAIAELERVRPQNWDAIEIELACAHAAAGRAQVARGILASVEKREFVDNGLVAQAYAELQDSNAAFVWLHRAYEPRSSQLPFLRVEPKFDRVRGDPRFGAMLRKLNLA
jgi:serine/threonine protein kinase/tetratricopeptide (TPR) repeat protein